MTDHIWQRDEVQSPCIRICTLHPAEQICIGCYRTGAEIAGWSRMTPEARAALLAELPERAGRLTRRRGGRAGRLAD